MAVKWPFSPEILDAMPERLAELYRALEITLLSEIASRLKISNQFNEVTIQQIRALHSHGVPLKEIQEAIQKATGKSREEINKLFADVVERNQAYYNGLAALAAITAPETIVGAADVAAIIRQTWSACRNITGSMGFLVVQGGRLVHLPPARAYQWALDNAVMEIESSAISYNQAISKATRKLADAGLTTVYYEPKTEGGKPHYDHIDVAARRAVMTAVSQINDKYREQSAEFLDTRYWEVSAHMGARNIPYPNPWSSHESWQGKIFYESEHGEPDPLGKYPDFIASTGFNTVDGLCGVNCRHNRSPFLPGIMEPTYSPKELEEMKAENHVIEFEGVKYDRYLATQEQRRIERTIRKWKRRLAASTSDQDAQTAKTRIQVLYQRYEEFSKAAGLRMQKERANVYVPMHK